MLYNHRAYSCAFRIDRFWISVVFTVTLGTRLSVPTVVKALGRSGCCAFTVWLWDSHWPVMANVGDFDPQDKDGCVSLLVCSAQCICSVEIVRLNWLKLRRSTWIECHIRVCIAVWINYCSSMAVVWSVLLQDAYSARTI